MTRIVSDEELRIALGKVNANIPFPSAQSFIGKLREKLDRGVNFKEARDYSLNESRIWGVSERAWYRKLAGTVFGARSARAATARSKKNPEKKGAAVKTSSEAKNSHALAIFEDTHGQLGFKTVSSLQTNTTSVLPGWFFVLMLNSNKNKKYYSEMSFAQSTVRRVSKIQTSRPCREGRRNTTIEVTPKKN